MKKSMGSDPGRGKAVGRFKNAQRTNGAQSPGQRAKAPRGKMKINKKP